MKKSKNNDKPGKKAAETQEGPSVHGLWSGTISFSLVAIPVRMVKAVEPGRVSFRMLHLRDYSPLERKMVCPDEGVIVAPDEIVRGYEIGPGQHITVTKEDLESVSPERSRTIEIAEFIDLNEVDPLYYDHPYFLVPLKGGEKAYSLLAECMKRTHKAGIAKFVMDEREYLVIIRSKNGALALSTLHYSDEILSDIWVRPDGVKAEKKDETDTIRRSIEKKMAAFAPDKYSNGRRQRLMELLEKKAKKAQVEAPEAGKESGEAVADLMAVLEESMRKETKKKR